MHGFGNRNSPGVNLVGRFGVAAGTRSYRDQEAALRLGSQAARDIASGANSGNFGGHQPPMAMTPQHPPQFQAVHNSAAFSPQGGSFVPATPYMNISPPQQPEAFQNPQQPEVFQNPVDHLLAVNEQMQQKLQQLEGKVVNHEGRLQATENGMQQLLHKTDEISAMLRALPDRMNSHSAASTSGREQRLPPQQLNQQPTPEHLSAELYRSRNLMAYGLPDSEVETHEACVDMVLEMMAYLVADGTVQMSVADRRQHFVGYIINISRVGKFGKNNKPRPVKIVFSDSFMRMDVFQAAHSLGRSTKFSGVSLDSDLTPKQQDMRRTVLQQPDVKAALAAKTHKLMWDKFNPTEYELRSKGGMNAPLAGESLAA